MLEVVWNGRRDGPGAGILLPPRDRRTVERYPSDETNPPPTATGAVGVARRSHRLLDVIKASPLRAPRHGRLLMALYAAMGARRWTVAQARDWLIREHGSTEPLGMIKYGVKRGYLLRYPPPTAPVTREETAP